MTQETTPNLPIQPGSDPLKSAMPRDMGGAVAVQMAMSAAMLDGCTCRACKLLKRAASSMVNEMLKASDA